MIVLLSSPLYALLKFTVGLLHGDIESYCQV